MADKSQSTDPCGSSASLKEIVPFLPWFLFSEMKQMSGYNAKDCEKYSDFIPSWS